MNRKFLDYLYDIRASIKKRLDELAEMDGNMEKCCDNMTARGETQIEMELKVAELITISETIDKYLEIHK